MGRAKQNVELKLETAGQLDEETGCVYWTGAVDSDGYGTISINGKTVRVHREVYQRRVGPLAAKQQVDHVCHNYDDQCTNRSTTCLHRRCINEGHLDAATQRENQGRRRRYFRCGHDRFGENVYATPSGIEYCVTCRKLREAATDHNARYRRRVAAETPEQRERRRAVNRKAQARFRARKKNDD